MVFQIGLLTEINYLKCNLERAKDWCTWLNEYIYFLNVADVF